MDERLIFVSIRNAVPRRKVAIPVPPGMTWEAFLTEVTARLKISSVSELVMAATGARVTSLDTLQDIDELHVLGDTGPSTSADTSFLGAPRTSARGPGHRVAAADTEITPAGPWDGGDANGGGGGGLGDDDDKYGPRAGAATRALARLFPALVPAASLPLTRHDVDGGGGRRGRSARARAPLPPARARRRARALFVILATAAVVLVIVNRWGAGGLSAAMPTMPSFGGGGEVEVGQ